jgi:hypothetical protein
MDSPGGSLVLVNGRVLTGDGRPSSATGVQLHGATISAVGTDAEVLAGRAQGDEVIDLAGRSIAPGFNDAHCHPLWVGEMALQVDCGSPPNRSIAAIIERLRERAASTPPGGWVRGVKYQPTSLAERRHPTRHDLDQATTQHPVLVRHLSGHVLAANSRALDLAGIARATPDPSGGRIDRDQHGEPTGVLREAAMELVHAVLPPVPVEEYKQAVRVAGEIFLANGVTSVGEAMVFSVEQLQAYAELCASGELPFRVSMMVGIDDVVVPHLIPLGVKSGHGDAWLRVGPAKFFIDGALGGRTARLRQPYRDQPESLGLWMDDPAAIKQRFIQAHLAGFQCTGHAIGDAAVELILDAYEEALRLEPRPNHRHRIEHACILDDGLLDRIQRLGAVLVPSPAFIHTFWETYLDAVGPERCRYVAAMRTFQRRGIVGVASTDAPVEAVNPALGLQSMVARMAGDGEPFFPEEAVSLDEAVRAYTLNGAHATFEEGSKGTIAPGMSADLVVFETDLRSVDPAELSQVRVDLTILDGRIVYERAT